jgi:hypothetical protein
MNDEFRPIYEKLYRSYQRPSRVLYRLRGGTFRASKEVTEAIEQVQRELKSKELPQLREDAKYFLLLNLVEMVYVPLSEENPSANIRELRPALQEDIKTIAHAASEEASQRGEKSVSAHTVIDTLHGAWDKLNSAVGRIWEKEM